MGAKISSFLHALYDPKKKQFLGRDGAGWGKLGVFYFFFYLGLAGFFCAMLAVFMALSPRDRPRYYSQSSRMRTRSNPLSPGLGFRPQPEVDKNIIFVKKASDESNLYAKSLDQYLKYYYPQQSSAEKQNKDSDSKSSYQTRHLNDYKFSINYPGNCTSANQYGFTTGQPCVLVKMNKVVGFVPTPGAAPSEKEFYGKTCDPKSNAIAVHCYGEYPADVDNIGSILYHSENGRSKKCGSLETKWFPYQGKQDRQDVYQAPYVWAQFLNPKPNVLINVLCRIYGENIDFDKKTARALTRFQIFVDTTTKESSSQGDH
jgi:sodium/potassium-transporting ATPase subunit beta